MITLTGTYGKANEATPTGYVDIQPMVTAVRLSTIITQAPVRADLANGAISVDIVASDDAGWDNGPIPYVFTERINGQSAQWMAYVNGPGPVDMSDLTPLDLPPDMYVPVPGPPNVLTVDSTTTGDPGTDADVTISGTSPEQALAFTIPRGDQGDPGPPPHIGDDEPTDPETVVWFDTNEPSVRGVLNSGDTMTGPLILSGDAVDPLGATPLQQVAQKSMVGNLLTDNVASGTDTLGTTAGFAASVCNLSSVTDQAASGSRSLYAGLTGTGAAIGPYTERYPVVAGQVYTGQAKYRRASGGRTAYLRLRFFTAPTGGTDVGSFSTPYTALVPGEWNELSISGIAPAGATWAYLNLACGAGGVGDSYYVDEVSLHAGAGGNWAMPGTPVTGLGTRITRPNVDDRLVEQWNGSEWSITDYDSGWRDLGATLLNGWTGTLYTRRINNVAYYSGTLIAPNPTQSGVVSNSVAAFLPPAAGPYFISGACRSGTTGALAAWRVTNAVVVDGIAANAYTFGASCVTAAAIPTSLPGTLVTPAPQ